MTKYLSDKLKAIGFVLMVMVVYIHAYNLKIKLNSGTTLISGGFNSLLQNFISQGVARIAVPLFFIISGYLFFHNIKKGSADEFLVKYRKRIKTLFVPYLLWSVYGVLLYLILQSIPLSGLFFTRDLIKDYSLSQLLSTIFLDPIPYQLWFIRDLMILMLISPLLFWLLKHFKIIVLLIFFATWVYGLDYYIFSNEALLFFALGAYVGIRKLDPQKYNLNTISLLVFTFSWILLLSIKTLLINIQYENITLIWILHKISIIFGIVVTWLLYDHIFSKNDISKKNYYYIFQYTFFLYVFHEPLLTIIQKMFYYLLGTSETASLLIYVWTPIFTIFVSILVGYYFKQLTPKIYYIMTGGR